MTIGGIVSAVAAHYDLPASELLGPRRHARVTEARHVAMALVRKRTAVSLPELGRYFDRDHTTCLSGVRKVLRLADTVPRMTSTLAAIELALDGPSRVRGEMAVWGGP